MTQKSRTFDDFAIATIRRNDYRFFCDEAVCRINNWVSVKKVDDYKKGRKKIITVRENSTQEAINR